MSGRPKSDELVLESVRAKLREALNILGNVQLFWQERSETCGLTVRKIVSLSEQLEACRNADLKRFPTEFPSDIKARLLYKIQIAVDEELRILYEILRVLEEKQNEVKSLCYKAIKAYREQSQCLKFNSVIQATAISPSISDMLEGIDEFQNMLTKDYLCRKITLANFSLADNGVAELKKHWKPFSVAESGSFHLNLMLNIPPEPN